MASCSLPHPPIKRFFILLAAASAALETLFAIAVGESVAALGAEELAFACVRLRGCLA